MFLFGVLPLVRKRGIGRLLIGDEFDTSARKVFKGVPHYDGLYDQSIWFDQALSRFFMRKGWSVSQFSVLRPLSELLIEKILALRYPQLQANQVSCHAAHKEGNRIVPCGKCEKCRRIVSMLSALDVDPKHCGYRDEQISIALAGFSKMGLSQEAVGVRHLGHMLLKKNLIPAPPDTQSSFGPQPEVLSLRFDPQVSPFNAIPVDLRTPLIQIYMQYAGGAYQRSGKKWNPVNSQYPTQPSA